MHHAQGVALIFDGHKTTWNPGERKTGEQDPNPKSHHHHPSRLQHLLENVGVTLLKRGVITVELDKNRGHGPTHTTSQCGEQHHRNQVGDTSHQEAHHGTTHSAWQAQGSASDLSRNKAQEGTDDERDQGKSSSTTRTQQSIHKPKTHPGCGVLLLRELLGVTGEQQRRQHW